MKLLPIITIAGVYIATSCTESLENRSTILAAGQMPNIAKDSRDNLHLVYGTGDSIMYSYSSNGGKDFSSPVLVSVLSKLAASHMRGPQVAATLEGVTVTACNAFGDIFTFVKDDKGAWKQTARVNDADTVCKEGLMALTADGRNVVAVWLDLRRDKHNKIFGARSTDGGTTWSKNFLIYASPDSSVCECCKPSVVMKGADVYVMFRNWLNGNRDLYLIHSSDGGVTFGQAQKLGNGSWALDGCPMDGGGLVFDENAIPQTVWKRKNKIYACEPGKEEKAIGEGRNCAVESVNGKNVYAWTENGKVVVLKPGGTKEKLGPGSIPLLKVIDNERVICVWENENQVHCALVSL